MDTGRALRHHQRALIWGPGQRLKAFDFIIIGGGMAGASAAYELAAYGTVLLLERESQPGYHSTGRSAALFSEAYGPEQVRALTTGGKPFFLSPPDGFTDHDILTPRGAMFLGRPDQEPQLQTIFEESRRLVDTIRLIDATEVLERVSVLRADYVGGGVLEPDAMDIDVHALHQGYLRGLRARGGTVVTDADVTDLTKSGADWRVATRAGAFAGPVVVNAAGAWADVIGDMAGAGAIGLVPKRRTAILFDPPEGVDSDVWPLVVDVDENFYFKPDAGKLLGSPADETPVPPCDVQPEDLDVAVAVDRIQTAADLPVRRIDHRWAGLRSFVPDKTPVVGYDPNLAGFFWLAGQGGYGIQTAPGLGRLAAALAAGMAVPADLADLGVSAAALSPARLSSVQSEGVGI